MDELLCVADPIQWEVTLAGLWLHLRLCFWYVVYGAGWEVLVCGLKLATVCVGSGDF